MDVHDKKTHSKNMSRIKGKNTKPEMKEQNFVRDKRSPQPKNISVSKVMSSNKAKNTKPELAFRKELSRAGLRGYRLHNKNVIGKPDIAFIKYKAAIFIHGCYWHRCPYCKLSLPNHNRGFWEKKFEANMKRDKKKVGQLKRSGWKVFVIWECRLKNKILNSIERVKKELTSKE